MVSNFLHPSLVRAFPPQKLNSDLAPQSQISSTPAGAKPVVKPPSCLWRSIEKLNVAILELSVAILELPKSCISHTILVIGRHPFTHHRPPYRLHTTVNIVTPIISDHGTIVGDTGGS